MSDLISRKLKELISDIWYGMFYRAGKFSHTKAWSNAGYAIFSWAIITKVINNTASDELFLIYISVTALHTTASSLLAKYDIKGKQDENT